MNPNPSIRVRGKLVLQIKTEQPFFWVYLLTGLFVCGALFYRSKFCLAN
jgi:hypothetical protein